MPRRPARCCIRTKFRISKGVRATLGPTKERAPRNCGSDNSVSVAMPEKRAQTRASRADNPAYSFSASLSVKPGRVISAAETLLAKTATSAMSMPPWSKALTTLGSALSRACRCSAGVCKYCVRVRPAARKPRVVVVSPASKTFKLSLLRAIAAGRVTAPFNRSTSIFARAKCTATTGVMP